jgi:hypothetical protein
MHPRPDLKPVSAPMPEGWWFVVERIGQLTITYSERKQTA